RMEERVLRVLEFNKIIIQLVSQAETTIGEDLARNTTLLTDISTVNEKQKETDEATTVLRLYETIPLGGIFDIRASLKRSLIGGVLTAEECLNVSSTVYGGRQVKKFLEDIEEDLPILKGHAETITPLRHLEQKINRCIGD